MIRKDETGAALPLVLVIVLGMSIFAFTLLMFSMDETRQVALDENQLKAHYLARSGAHTVADYIINNPDDIMKILGQESEDVELGEGYYKVIVTDQSTPEEILYRITSTGVVNGASKQIDVTVESKGLDAALYANVIEITGNGNIKGADVVYGVAEEELDPNHIQVVRNAVEGGYELKFGHHEFESVILPCEDEKVKEWFKVEEDGIYDIKDGCPNNIPESIKTNKNISRLPDISEQYDIIEVSRNHTLIIGSENISHDLLIKANEIVTEGSNIEVELNGNTIILVADYIYPSGKGNTPGILVKDVSGTNAGGHLIIYCHRFEPKTGNSAIQVEKNSDNVFINVYIYTKDGNGGYMSITGTPYFNGSIYAPDAEAVLVGNASIQGWVIADKASFTGNGNLNFSAIQSLTTSMSFEFLKIRRWTYLDYISY